MKIVFWGNGDFALISLKKLASKHQIIAVVTSPDKRKGRGLKISIDPVKKFSGRQGFIIYEPQNFSPTFIAALKKKKPHLFVVVNYGKKLTQEILDIPMIYCINLHPSLLPKYRGSAPINWVLIKGEKKTGISIIKIGRKIDAGEIIYQKEIEIKKGENARELSEELAQKGADGLIKAIDLISTQRINLRPQNEKEATYFPKLRKSDGEIDWSRPAYQIHNLIRGFTPKPGAFTFWNGKKIKIWKTEIYKGKTETTTSGIVLKIDKNKGILIETGKQALWIEELQMAGRKKMTSKEFIIGHRIKKGEKLCKLE